MNQKFVLIVLIMILATDCSPDRNTNVSWQTVPAGGYHGPMMGPMMRGPQRSNSELTFKSNGQRIYYTATSNSDQVITASGGPFWFQMHGGSCVDCHGPDGHGGYIIHMTNETAPNITYKALTSEEHEMPGDEGHPPYTDTTIKRAITKGLDPAGHELSYVMPRWSITDSDLNDLISYLKTLAVGNNREVAVMPYHDGMYFSPWGWLMMAFMMLFWVVVVGGIVWLVVYLTRRSGRGQGTTPTDSALDILNQRYARGEISKDEYEQMRKDITAR